MANEVEIRVTSTNNAGAGFEQVRRMVREVGQEAETSGRRTRQMGNDTDHTGRAAARAAGMLARAGAGFADMGRSASEAAMQITGRSGPVGAFAALATALTAAPMLAQAAGAGITLGVGGALAGLGLKAAASSDRVKDSFAQMKGQITEDFRELAKPFETSLLSMPRIAETAFEQLRPHLEKAFPDMAPQVTEFVRDLGDGFSELGPTIDAVAAKFGPMLDTLGNRMPDIMSTVGDAITKITEGADPESLDAMIDGLNGLVTASAAVIRELERVGSTFADVWGAAKEAGGAIKDLVDPVTAAESQDLGRSIGNVGQAALEAAAGVDELKGKLEELAGQQLSAREATRAFEEAIDEANQAARENGKTLNVNTKAGRANQKALDDIAASALEMQKAVKDAGGDSTEAMARARRQFIATAMGMGQSRAAAERLADRLGLVKRAADRIPKSKQIQIRDNARTVTSAVNILSGSIRSMPSSKTVTVSFRTIGAAALDAARNLLADIPGAAGGRAHGGIIGAAGGGPRANWTLVGEQGPELVKLAPGSTVHTAGATRSMLGGETQGRRQGPSLGREITIVKGATSLEQLLLELLRKIIRTNGGDPVAVLTR